MRELLAHGCPQKTVKSLVKIKDINSIINWLIYQKESGNDTAKKSLPRFKTNLKC